MVLGYFDPVCYNKAVWQLQAYESDPVNVFFDSDTNNCLGWRERQISCDIMTGCCHVLCSRSFSQSIAPVTAIIIHSGGKMFIGSKHPESRLIYIEKAELLGYCTKALMVARLHQCSLIFVQYHPTTIQTIHKFESTENWRNLQHAVYAPQPDWNLLTACSSVFHADLDTCNRNVCTLMYNVWSS